VSYNKWIYHSLSPYVALTTTMISRGGVKIQRIMLLHHKTWWF